MMSDGWILIGGKNSLKLKKDDTEINFDIAIPTPRGMIYAMKIKRDLIPEDGEGTIIQELEKVTEEEEESEDEKPEDTEETTVDPDEITLQCWTNRRLQYSTIPSCARMGNQEKRREATGLLRNN